MPKKTLALISGLVIVTVILFVVALRTSKQQAPQNITTQAQIPTPTPVAMTTLSFAPNPITVAPGGQGTVSVNINTSLNKVTAVQLEIAYDPNIISNVQVTTGPLFQNAVVLINRNNTQTGRLTYAFGITPNHPTVEGVGSVATITFTANNVPGKQAQLALLPTSLVTARGVAPSVLKSETGTLVNIGTATNAVPQTSTGTSVPVVRQSVPMTPAQAPK